MGRTVPANRIAKILAIILLTLLSSLFDSQGFVHSARIWMDGRWVWREVARASLSFGVGFLPYWLSIRYLNEFGIVSPEVQTLGWFVVTIAGVAVFSGDFMRWPAVDRMVALGVLGGLCWLLFRAGG
jgi:hypothetical protein